MGKTCYGTCSAYNFKTSCNYSFFCRFHQMTRLCLTNIFGPAPLRNSINTTTRLSASLILTIPPTKEPPLMYVHLYPFFHPYYTINNQHNLYIIIILRLMQHSFFVTHAVQCNHCVCTKLSHKIWSDCSRS